MSSVLEKADYLVNKGLLLPQFYEGFQQLYEGYKREAERRGMPVEPVEEHFLEYIEIIEEQLHSPHPFAPIHHRLCGAHDYFRFGLRQARLMLDEKNSLVWGQEHLHQMQSQVAAGENVVLLSNHQTELDCHLFSYLVEETVPNLVDRMIWVAGNRVVSDPVAIPLSLGLHLICIHSKKHLEHPPEQKAAKLNHNRQTMHRVRELLSEGGQCITLFPSGGRDRTHPEGPLQPAPFDPGALEMFRLLGLRCGKPTHFYPMALATYDLLPPPAEVGRDLGERRDCRYVPVGIGVCEEVDLDKSLDPTIADKHLRRMALSEHVWKIVADEYNALEQSLRK